MRDLFSRFLSRFESLNRSLIKYIKRVYHKSGIYGMSIGSLVFFCICLNVTCIRQYLMINHVYSMEYFSLYLFFDFTCGIRF